jgi:hypothetical protein
MYSGQVRAVTSVRRVCMNSQQILLGKTCTRDQNYHVWKEGEGVQGTTEEKKT